jgi:hypothetical protein
MAGCWQGVPGGLYFLYLTFGLLGALAGTVLLVFVTGTPFMGGNRIRTGGFWAAFLDSFCSPLFTLRKRLPLASEFASSSLSCDNKVYELLLYDRPHFQSLTLFNY